MFPVISVVLQLIAELQAELRQGDAGTQLELIARSIRWLKRRRYRVALLYRPCAFDLEVSAHRLR